MKDTQFAKVVVFTCSLVPVALLIVDKFTGRADPSPSFYVLRCTGLCSMIFLALSLAVTPLRRITGKNYWSLFRRMLGLFAFAYAMMHLLTYLFWYRANVTAIWEDLSRPFILFGLTALLIMVPLAATSTAWAIKKMGNKKWKWLHRSVYVAAVAASVHYLMQGKIIMGQPLIFGAVLWGLLAFRLVWAMVDAEEERSQTKAGGFPVVAERHER